MPFGQQAFENSHQPFQVVDQYLRHDIWNDDNIEDFVSFWSRRLWLTIDGMHERVESVFINVLNALDPTIEAIIISLKTKNRRWKNEEVNRIAPIIQRSLVRNVVQDFNQMEHHNNFQNELGKIGPVRTVWCHYLIEPIAFPPIDRFNYSAYRFITQHPQNLPPQVPNNFWYIPICDPNTDYQNFRWLFLNVLTAWRNGQQTVQDVVNLDRALMSFGAFIRKNNQRQP